MPDGGYPRVELIEEGLREGMQIESADISVDDKLTLIDALSRAGVPTIVVGSFVSPKWTPQMANVDELIGRLRPLEGIVYTALALNDRGRERMAAFTPPLSPIPGPIRTMVHLCDVFVRRNTNRSQEEEIASWPKTIARAVETGASEAGIGINAAWGSNWLGKFSLDQRMSMLRRQYEAWSDAGLPVTSVWIGDPMAWNMPDAMEEQINAILAEFPSITRFHLHLHNARGTAPISAYTALKALDPRHTLVLDTSIGGIGGCPYCGHGRMTKMIPTEDIVDLLHELGIDTGIDLDLLIEAGLLAEKIIGRSLYSHVTAAGPRPRGEKLFAMDMPFIETAEEAQHFRLGPSVYADAPSPWRTPISSPARSALHLARDNGTTAPAPDGVSQ